VGMTLRQLARSTALCVAKIVTVSRARVVARVGCALIRRRRVSVVVVVRRASSSSSSSSPCARERFRKEPRDLCRIVDVRC